MGGTLFGGLKSGKHRQTMFSHFDKTPSVAGFGDKRSGTAQMRSVKFGINRPHTAAIEVAVQRPQTGAVPKVQAFGHNSLANLGPERATSAMIPNVNEKLANYEDIISRLKKNLEREKQNIRHVRTQIAKEIKQKSELEKIMR